MLHVHHLNAITMKLFFCIISCFIGLFATAGDGNYAVSAIPLELLKNANMVKRVEEIAFTVKNVSKATLYHHYVYTILNERGDKFAQAVEMYDKLQTIDYIDGNLFDAEGKKIRSLKKSDIKDYSGNSEISLADDNRIKAHNFLYRVYPYTVEYTISVDYNHTMLFPDWAPLDDEAVSVQSSQLRVVFPANYKIRYKAYNYTSQPAEENDKTNKVLVWQVKNLPAIDDEILSPPYYEITPTVFLAPTAFEVQGYSGDMSTWEDFGKFRQALLGGRDVLPANVKEEVHRLIAGVTDNKEKIRRLYSYMQKNTRYISIQLGIGGWQPFDATYVATRKYGDCKALSNFMEALLKEAGVTSYYTVIRAGRGETDFHNDFPSNQFNHAILCAIDKTDTVWLECTSQTTPPGYMGSFTGDRYALMITENGGKLVRTPKYSMNDNFELRRTKAVVDETGNLTIDVVTAYGAIRQDELHEKINGLSKEKVLDILKEEIDLPQYNVVNYSYNEAPSSKPVITETLQLIANNYAQVTGKRLFIAPNILTKTHQKIAPVENRKYDLVLETEYIDIDTAEIKLPSGYQPEAVPAPVMVESKFGKYSARVKVEGDKIIYYRSMEKYSGHFPPKDYNELVKFYDQIYKADRNKVVLVKKSE